MFFKNLYKKLPKLKDKQQTWRKFCRKYKKVNIFTLYVLSIRNIYKTNWKKGKVKTQILLVNKPRKLKAIYKREKCKYS